MPKSLKLHSNERIDLVDFELAANGYSLSLDNHHVAKTILDKYSQVLSGFRIQLADQSVAPGQLTVLSGVAYDKSGRILNIEDQPDASLTTTLAGASQTFYLEVEFTEVDSDLDSRGFWDPTIDQASPIPDGGEVLVSVATRKTPSWKIVSPISTTGFTYLSLPNSNRVPIAVLSTDVSNQIDSSVNLFGSLEYPSTVVVTDLAATATTLSVVDSHLFPIGSVVTVDLGGTSPEVGRTIINNDLENHVLTVSPALATNHLAGAIVRRTDAGTDTLVPEQTDPNAAAYAAVTPATRPNDYRKRFYGGDELRGSGLLKSAKTFGTRDDLKIKSQKDHTDFIAALLRDLKFGSPRADSNVNTPPVTFSSTPRYFDSAGSISGAKNNTISIGNGTTTYGDLNGTTDSVFTAAVTFLAANGGGTVYIKKGTYTFTNQVTIPDGLSIRFVGESKSGVTLINNRAATAAIVVSDTGGLTTVGFENINTLQAGGSLIFLSGIGSYSLTIINSSFAGINTLVVNKLLVDNSSLGNINTFSVISEASIRDSSIVALVAAIVEDMVCVNSVLGPFSTSSYISRSTFIGCTTAAITTPSLVACLFESCSINDVITVSTSIQDVSLFRCNSTVAFLPTKLLNVTGSSVDQLSIFNCRFAVTGNNIYTQASGTVTNIAVQNCDFRSVSIPTQTVPLFDFSAASVSSGLFSNTTFDSPMTAASPITSGIQFSSTWSVLIEGCSFNTAGSVGTTSTNVVRAISVTASVNTAIRDCYFTQSTTTEFTQGIYSSGAADLLIDNCSFVNGYSALTAVNAGSTIDQIVVSNCEFNHSAAIDYSAFSFSGSQILTATVLNSSFNYNGISGASLIKQGILFSTSQSSLTVSNCNFTDFGLNSTANTFGIRVDASATDSDITVNNNIFSDFIGPSAVSAISVIAPGASIRCVNNTFRDFSVGTGVVVNLFNIKSSIFSSNIFVNCVSTSNLVRHRNSVNTKINNNLVSDCLADTLFNVLIDSGLTTQQDVSITDNIINNETVGTPTLSGIIVYSDSFTRSVICQGNIVHLFEGLNGISISGTTTNLRDVNCSGNNVSVTGTGRAIVVESCARGVVSNNVYTMSGTPATGILRFDNTAAGVNAKGTCMGNVCPSGASPSPLAIVCAGYSIIMAYNITGTFDSNTSIGGSGSIGNI